MMRLVLFSLCILAGITAGIMICLGSTELIDDRAQISTYEKVKETAYRESTDALPNVSALKEVNPDTCGYLVTNDISLPIVASKDNQEYLKRDFMGNKSEGGCLFVSMLNNPDFNDKNTVIYGHNMKNGTMFGGLKRYLDENYFYDNPYLNIYTQNKSLKYKILGVATVEDGTKSYLPDVGGGDLKDYLGEINKRFNIINKLNVDKINRIVTLSTCISQGSNSRLILVASLEDENER